MNNNAMIAGLVTQSSDPGLKEKLMLFGQFVGDWEIESEWYLPDGSIPKGRGEIHFGWILILFIGARSNPTTTGERGR